MMEEMTHGFVNIDDYEGKKKIQTDKDFKSLQFQRKNKKDEDQMTSCLKKCLLG